MRLGVTRLLLGVLGLQTKELNGSVFIIFPFQIFQILNVDRILLLCAGYSHGYHGELDMVVIPDYQQDLLGVMPIFLSLSQVKLSVSHPRLLYLLRPLLFYYYLLLEMFCGTEVDVVILAVCYPFRGVCHDRGYTPKKIITGAFFQAKSYIGKGMWFGCEQWVYWGVLRSLE